MLFGSIIVYFFITYEANFYQLSPLHWWILTAVFTITSMLAISQPTLLALIYGFFLKWYALPHLFLLNMVAIYLVNVVANRLDNHRFLHLIEQNPKAMQLLTNIRSEELKVIFFAKLSPILPFALTNFIFAISGAKLQNILLGGFLGMIPRTILAIWIGIQARDIRTLLENNGSNSTQRIVLLSLFIISTIGLVRLVRSKLKP